MYSLSTAAARDIEERLQNKQATAFYNHLWNLLKYKSLKKLGDHEGWLTETDINIVSKQSVHIQTVYHAIKRLIADCCNSLSLNHPKLH